MCRNRQATKTEDNIFSILGLVSDENRDKLLDSTRTGDGTDLRTLYTNYARVLADGSGWSYVFSLIGIGATESRGLPSWVPDLRLPLHSKPFWYYGCTNFRATSGPCSFSIEMSEDVPGSDSNACLRLFSAHIDEIVQVGEALDKLFLEKS